MIPFIVPLKFATKFAAGSIVRHGALLKDSGSGQIVGHLQETSLLQSALGGANPFSLSSWVGVGQNFVTIKKLNEVQSQLSFMQGLQYLNLAGTVVSVGVNVASAIMILKRVKRIEGKVAEINSKLDVLMNEKIHSLLIDLETQAERIEELINSKNADDRSKSSEDKLHHSFNHFHSKADELLRKNHQQLDLNLLMQAIVGMAISSSLSTQNLIWFNDYEVAYKRAALQFEKFHKLNQILPCDRLITLTKDEETARQFSGQISDMRRRLSSMPQIITHLNKAGVSGSDYITTAQENNKEHFLVFPATPRLGLEG